VTLLEYLFVQYSAASDANGARHVRLALRDLSAGVSSLHFATTNSQQQQRHVAELERVARTALAIAKSRPRVARRTSTTGPAPGVPGIGQLSHSAGPLAAARRH
jgi:hypothetical protein